MLERIYWALEIISLAICANSIYGVKIKPDIKTIVWISIEGMFMHLFERGIITSYTYFIIYVLYVLFVYLEFKNSLKNSIFTAVLSMIIVGLIQMIVAFPVYQIGDFFEASENIMVLIINVLVFLITMLISKTKVFHNVYEVFDKRELVINLTFLVILLVYFYCLYLLKYSERIQTDMYVIIIVMVATIGCILFRWQTTDKDIQNKEHQIALSNSFNNEYNALIQTSRKKQHDFNNQINAIYGMDDITDKKEQNHYIGKLIDDNKITKILHLVEQPIIAGFLYRKVREIIESNIDIELNLSVPEKELGMDVFDCVEILGILLDNAVEAVSDKEDKNIILEIYAMKEHLSIMVKNVSAHYENDEMVKFFEKGYSSKGDNRGIGLTKIKDLQRKYKFDIFVEMQEIYNKNWISFSIIKK